MTDKIRDANSALAAMMSDPDYLKMLLGLAIAKLPEGHLEVGFDDYAALVGQALVLSPGSSPERFRLVVKAMAPPAASALRPVGQA